MPPKSSVTLTEAELRLMRVLWQRGESAVSELMTAIASTTPIAYTSVLTTIRILEKKGYVCHRQDGRAFLYSPIVAQHEASRSELKHMLQRFFGNSREKLLLSVLGEQQLSAEELRRIRQAIDEAVDDSPATAGLPSSERR
jgi:predicted transcriptional regulator